MACEGEPLEDVENSLEVSSPVSGTVAVGTATGDLAAHQTLRVKGVGEPPYTVTLHHAGGRVSLLDVTQSFVDFKGLLPDSRPVDGRLVELCVQPAEPDAEAIALQQGVVVVPEVRDFVWCWQLAAEEEAWILARFGEPEEARALGLRRIRRVEADSNRTLALGEEIALSSGLLVEVPRLPAGAVSAELTLGGLRTGLRVGASIAEPGVVARLPRADEAHEELGLWLRAEARRVGGVVEASSAVHLPIDAQQAVLAWLPALQTSPRPGPRESAGLVRRVGEAVIWSGVDAASLMRLELEGTDGCRRARWTVVTDAAAEGLSLPKPVDQDPLSLPLIRARTEVIELSGIEYQELIGRAAFPPVELPLRSPRVRRRAVEGFWRGGSSDCEASDLRGRYALHEPAVCRRGVSAPTVVVDHCGVLLPSPQAARIIGCGHLEDGALVTEDARVPIEVEEGVIVVGTRPQLRLVPLEDGPGDPPGPDVVGSWYRVQVREQRRRVEDGVATVGLGEVVTRFTGGPEAGPWLEVDAAGRATFAAGELSFEGVVRVSEAGRRLIVRPSGCEGEERSFAISVAAEGLRLTELALDAAGASGLERRLVFNR